jgi:hypothetical protein
MKLTDIAGDSSIERVAYADGVAEVVVCDSETGESFLLRVPTRNFYSEASQEHGSVQIRLLALAEHLPIHANSGRYMAPDTFEQQMQAVSGGLHLALGLRASEFPVFLAISGYRILFACPISSEQAVTVHQNED